MPAIFGRWPSHKLNLVAVTVFLCLAATSFSTAYESALIPRDTNSKLVFSHFVVGLTINYTSNDWNTQMKLAASHNIDAFVLNVGKPVDWQVAQVKSAYDVATKINLASGGPFKLFLSLDMSQIETAADVTTWVSTFAPMPAQLLINSRPLISTFSGEANKLGGQNISDGWNSAVKVPLAALNPPLNALFVPAWSSLDPATAVSDNPVLDGIMTWLSWPTGNEVMTTTVDSQFQKSAKAAQKLYMAGVSPCFSTHYDYKNYIFKSDDNLFITRWKELIALPTQPDFIQIISWNDYGESHYIGPVSGTPPANTTWLNGFDHTAWLDMSDYFIQWYKTGSQPTIKEDTVYYNYRPHSVNAVASSDPLPLPTNASVSIDAVYASAFLTPDSSARQVRVSIGGSPQTFSNLSSDGLTTLTAPWTGNGGKVEVALLDANGKEIMKKTATNAISNKISTYNFNYASGKLSKSDAKSPAASIQPCLLSLAVVMVVQASYHILS